MIRKIIVTIISMLCFHAGEYSNASIFISTKIVKKSFTVESPKQDKIIEVVANRSTQDDLLAVFEINLSDDQGESRIIITQQDRSQILGPILRTLNVSFDPKEENLFYVSLDFKEYKDENGEIFLPDDNYIFSAIFKLNRNSVLSFEVEQVEIIE